MIKFVIAFAILLIAAAILFIVYNFGFFDFYHPLKKAEKNQIKVACVGDSITFGCTVWNWRKNNYPTVLNKLLGDKYCVNNFGYTNRTAIKSADYPYTNEKLYRQSLEFNPDIVVIMLGSNDSKENNWDKYKFVNDYCDIIDSYKVLSTNPDVYILLPPPLFEVNGKVTWQLRKDVVADDVCPAVKQIAELKEIKYIDMYSVFENKKELFSDGVHPNSKGSKRFAQKIYEVISRGYYEKI